MTKRKRRGLSREVKLPAVERMTVGESASGPSRELQLDPVAKVERVQDIASARKRIAELERKVGQQQAELEFFRQALQRVGGARQPGDRPGVSASTPRSRR